MTRKEEIKQASDKLFDDFTFYSKTYKMGFEAGAIWADNHPKSPWISVDDDLPCNHQELLDAKYKTKEVFVLKTGDLPYIDYMLKIDGKWTWFEYKTSKFWMPIPELPK